MVHEKQQIQKYKLAVSNSTVCIYSCYSKTTQILQEFSVTKTTLFILILGFKDSSAKLSVLITSIHTHLDLTTELLLSSTEGTQNRNNLCYSYCFSLTASRKAAFIYTYSKYRMYRRQSYIQKCINIVIHLAEIQEKNPGLTI